MVKFRIIPSILTDGHRVLKGKNFESTRPVGVLEPLINIYESRDVDELIILDTKATQEKRNFNYELLKSACSTLSIPLAIGGGFNNVRQIETALKLGADKIVIGDACFKDEYFIQNASSYFGSQCLVGSLDIRILDENNIYLKSGLEILRLDPVEAALKLESLGIGEILIQIIDKEGTLSGVNIDIPSQIVKQVNIPVVYSGGISSCQDFLSIARNGFAGAAAGALFQFTEHTPKTIREYLEENGIPVRKTVIN
jgi:cyclase